MVGCRAGVVCPVLAVFILGACGDPAAGALDEGAEHAAGGFALRPSLEALFSGEVPWVSFYGSADELGNLERVADAFRIINVDADPGVGNLTRQQIQTLKAGGKNLVLSYLNLGSCERFRDYWWRAPPGLMSCFRNRAAHLGAYPRFSSEVWMNPANPDYQRLVLEHIAPRLVAQGVDGFFLDNLELLEHPGLCDAACVQGGLDLVYQLRRRYPRLLLIMQNATGGVTRLGWTGGVPFASLLDGISHESIYFPRYRPEDERELQAWRAMNLYPGHRFWIATEDYVGSCRNVRFARQVYRRSRAMGFSPYVADSTGGQQVVCFWRL